MTNAATPTTPTTTPADAPAIMVGLPFSTRGKLIDAAQAVGAPILISAGSLHRRRRRPDANGERPWSFCRIGDAAWLNNRGACLDSAGFVAMRQGGYRWTVSEYVEMVVTNHGDDNSCQPFPWIWWSAMDYCCEQEIAADRAQVDHRIDLTIASYGEHLDELDYWQDEGVTDVPDPMPVLQGRVPADYLRCAQGIAAQLREHGRDGLPALVGVGSVCRRQLHGPDGLLTVLDALHAALPAGVQLHLFGVKGDVLPHLVTRYPGRVQSIDSMAWDYAARMDARKAGERNTVDNRAAHLISWYTDQAAKLAQAFEQDDGDDDPDTDGERAPADDTDTDSDQLDLFDADPRCPYCDTEIELDGLISPDGDTMVDWLPCCQDALDHVQLYGWDDYAGERDVDTYNRCTGEQAHHLDHDEGDSLALWKLEIVNPGPGVRGWQTDVFADVTKHHRHHRAPQGWKYGIAVYNGRKRVGVAVVGRPVSRHLQAQEPYTLEITRVCTWGSRSQRRNAASKLYGAACREAKRRGYKAVITYTLADVENGSSLKASNFTDEHQTKGGSWDRPSRGRDDKAPTGQKIRWRRWLSKWRPPVEEQDDQDQLEQAPATADQDAPVSSPDAADERLAASDPQDDAQDAPRTPQANVDNDGGMDDGPTVDGLRLTCERCRQPMRQVVQLLGGDYYVQPWHADGKRSRYVSEIDPDVCAPCGDELIEACEQYHASLDPRATICDSCDGDPASCPALQAGDDDCDDDCDGDDDGDCDGPPGTDEGAEPAENSPQDNDCDDCDGDDQADAWTEVIERLEGMAGCQSGVSAFADLTPLWARLLASSRPSPHVCAVTALSLCLNAAAADGVDLDDLFDVSTARTPTTDPARLIEALNLIAAWLVLPDSHPGAPWAAFLSMTDPDPPPDDGDDSDTDTDGDGGAR